MGIIRNDITRWLPLNGINFANDRAAHEVWSILSFVTFDPSVEYNKYESLLFSSLRLSSIELATTWYYYSSSIFFSWILWAKRKLFTNFSWINYVIFVVIDCILFHFVVELLRVVEIFALLLLSLLAFPISVKL